MCSVHKVCSLPQAPVMSESIRGPIPELKVTSSSQTQLFRARLYDFFDKFLDCPFSLVGTLIPTTGVRSFNPVENILSPRAGELDRHS